MGYAIIIYPSGETGFRAVDSEADLVTGETFSLTPPAPSAADVAMRFLPLLQGMLDRVAQQNGYDNALSCVSYEGCGVAEWEADAAAIKAYRTALWAWGYAQQPVLATMTPEQLTDLTMDDILAQAPDAADSGWVIHPRDQVTPASE